MDWKKLWPHAASILIMALATIAYCSPILKGKVLVQGDIVKYEAQINEVEEHREQYGEEPLWVTQVFSGMTTFNIGTKYPANWITYLKKALLSSLPSSANLIFLLCLGFYVMMVSMGVSPWLALIGALAYGFSTNLLVSLMAGHNTKVLTTAFMAPALASVLLVYRGKLFVGSALAAISVSLMISANHFQIEYYFLMMAFIAAIIYFIDALKQKTLPQFWKASGVLVVAGIIGFLPNFSNIYNVYEHTEETTRGGKSELSTKKAEDKDGLDRDYAMSWSNSPKETFTLLVPSATGGAAGDALPEDGNVAEALKKFQLNRQQKESILGRAPTYFGDQPFVQGPIYFGVVFIFLFILAFFIVERKIAIWVAAVVLLSLFMSWGRHFSLFTDFLFDYFPLYNKFRTPSMALTIAGVAIPFLGILGVSKWLSDPEANLRPALMKAIYVMGGLLVLGLLYGLIIDWKGPSDGKYQTEGSPWSYPELYEALLADRKSMYFSDWIMALVLTALAAGALYVHSLRKLKPAYLLVALALVTFGDSWRVSKRYLNNDTFVTEKKYQANFQPSPADQTILQDPDPHYRVLNLSTNPFTDGPTSYFHENAGGHHAAKLQLYQDLIENKLRTEIGMVNSGLGQANGQVLLNPATSGRMTALNMLNVKYLIIQPNNAGGAVRNQTSLGHAWFVQNLKWVASADEEMAALSDFDPAQTAILRDDYEAELGSFNPGSAQGANIQLTNFRANELGYTTSNSEEGLAVFSEVYYRKGWKAYVDGNEVPIYRVNYLLRAIKVPAGEHEVKMEFIPESYAIGERVSLAGSILFLLFVGGMIWKARQPKPADPTA